MPLTFRVMEDLSTAAARFEFLAHAFHGTGGFRPSVTWENQELTTTDAAGNTVKAIRRMPKLSAPSYLVPYQRESAERHAARNAVAVYENHLRTQCERFVGYLARRKPMRTGTEAPLVQLLLEDGTLANRSLDEFLDTVALHTKARGSMLVVLDMPRTDRPPVSLLEQIKRRHVPYVRMIEPERVCGYEMDSESGLFISLSITCTEEVDGKATACVRTWDARGWSIKAGDKVVSQGTHPFGRCPVLAITETGDPFPVVGKFAQIADMSLRIFNAQSELDELLRGQTFSLLTMQVPPEAATFDVAGAAATIGVHSMLVHPGNTPAFISPDSGPAQTYLARIESLQQGIKRVAMDEATTDSGQAESGVARRLRFEQLNAALASFAKQMQSLERQIWALFNKAVAGASKTTTEWPTDFNLVDTLGELDVLTSMQAAGFGPKALTLKRKTIAAAEFDAADEEDKAAVLAEIREQAQEPPTPPITDPLSDPADSPGATPPQQ